MDDMISRRAAIERVPPAVPVAKDTNVPSTDTISRQQAIATAVSAAIDWHRLANPQYSIAYSIGEAMRALPPAQRWIPCSERLPEKPGQYYVSGGDKVWICEFLIIATTNIPNFIGGWCNDVANPVVQAWMPLPEPYREDTP